MVSSLHLVFKTGWRLFALVYPIVEMHHDCNSEDYPEENDAICVVDVFDTYEEGPYTYCTLRSARHVNE